jgi:hypothetical protein
MREDDWLNRPWRPARSTKENSLLCRAAGAGSRRLRPSLRSSRRRSSNAAPPITLRTAITPFPDQVGRSAERARGRDGSSEPADALESHVELERGPARPCAPAASGHPGGRWTRERPAARAFLQERYVVRLLQDGVVRLSYNAARICRRMASCAFRTMAARVFRTMAAGVFRTMAARASRTMAPRASPTCASRRIGGVAARLVEGGAILCYRSGARPGPSDSRLRL